MPSEFIKRQLREQGIDESDLRFSGGKKERSNQLVLGDSRVKVEPLPNGVVADIDIKIESVANKREHWAAKHRRAKKHRALASKIPEALLPDLPCVVVLTRIAPRQLDGDNLQSGFKALRDGIADVLGVDDADPSVTWRYRQMRGEPKQYAARITITAKGY